MNSYMYEREGVAPPKEHAFIMVRIVFDELYIAAVWERERERSLESDREGAFSLSIAYSSDIGKREGASNLTERVPSL